jgi:RES domain
VEVAYRHASYATPLRTVPSAQPGRYHRGDEPEPTQYLCLHPLGPLAELVRAHDLRSRDQLYAVATRTWALRIDLDGLLELTFENAPEHGVGAGDLVADNPLACRRLAHRLRREVPGLVVPSAALPGTRNVVLFGARVASPYLVEAVGAVDVPASVTADGARPLLGLVERVRFRGRRHAELEAWRRGTRFEFTEPSWALPAPR